MFGGLARLCGGGPGASGPHGFGDGYHLIVLHEHTLHIMQCSRGWRCCCNSVSRRHSVSTIATELTSPSHPVQHLPSPHELTFEPWQHLPLETLTHIWLPYQTHGLAVATRRSDVILRWADMEMGWLSFSHNQSRGEFLDYLQRHYGHSLVIDHLDLDDPATSHDNSNLVGQNWAFLLIDGTYEQLSPATSLSPPPEPTEDTQPSATPPSPPPPPPTLIFEDRHSSDYEVTLLTLYMHLPPYRALPSREVSFVEEGLDVALLAQVRHGIALALEGNALGMALLTVVVEGAICLDRSDLHALSLIGVALAECRGQRYTAAMAHIETSYRLSWESGHDVGCFIASVGQYDVHCAQTAWDAAYASLRRAQHFAPAKLKPLVHSRLQALHDRVQGKDAAAPSAAVATGWRRVLSPRRSSGDLIASTLTSPKAYFTAALLDDMPVADVMYRVSPPTVLVKVSPQRQYRVSYDPQWTVHTLLSHVVARHEHTVHRHRDHHHAQPVSSSHNSCIVGLVYDMPSHQGNDQVLGLHQSLATVLASSTSSNRFKAILANRPAVPDVVSGVTVACSLCQRQIPLELVEAHECS